MRSWKSQVQALILLAVWFALAEAAIAKKVRIPVTRDSNGVPVQCILDPKCHNRFRPAIPPVAHADPGDTAVFETRDAFDNQFNFGTIPPDVAGADASRIHPLTGPLLVNGAMPRDILVVTIVHIGPGPDNFGYTVLFPGFGFLRDLFTAPDIARWSLTQAAATSSDMSGIRISTTWGKRSTGSSSS